MARSFIGPRVQQESDVQKQGEGNNLGLCLRPFLIFSVLLFLVVVGKSHQGPR
jgi:hypothetical protein